MAIALPQTRSISGGPLVWATVLALAVGAYGVALASGRGDLVVAAGLSLAVPLVFAWRLEAGVLLVVLARPSLDVFADRNLASVGGAQLNPASLLAVLVIAVGLPYMIERWPELRRAAAIRPYLAFAVIAAVGVPLAPSITNAATEWLRLSAIVVTYALAFLAASSRRSLARLLAVAVASALLPSLVGVGQWVNGSTRSVGDLNRTTGTFLHPDPYGIYLALVVVAGLAVFLAGRSLWRWLALAVVVSATAALVLSYTRTGWVMVVLGVLVLGVARYRWLLVVGPLALAIAFAAVPGVSARFHELTKAPEVTYDTGDSFQSRVALWRENLPKAQERPLTGLGFGAIVDQSSDCRTRAFGLRAGAGRDRRIRVPGVPVAAAGGRRRLRPVAGGVVERFTGADRRLRGRAGRLRLLPAGQRRLEPDDPERRQRHRLDADRMRPRGRLHRP